MRARLTFLAVALFAILALAGCGDDNKSDAQNPPPVPTAATGGTGSASDAAKRAFEACTTGAEALPDEQQSADAKKRCQEAYDNLKNSTKKVDEAVANSRKKCEETAERIPNDDVREQALEACKQFK